MPLDRDVPAAVADSQPRRRRDLRWLKRLAAIGSAGVPVLGLVTSNDTTLLIYTFFVVALLNRQRLGRLIDRLRVPSAVRVIAAMVLAGWLAETCAWLGAYLQREPEPVLFHPQLVPDLLLALGFYGGWGLAWLLLLPRWHWRLPQVFVTAGLFGVVVENDGAVFLQIVASLANPLAAAVLAAYVLVVYGSAVGLGYLLASPRQPEKPTIRRAWLKYPAAWAGMFIGQNVAFYGVAIILMALHLVPSRQPIWLHPFW